MKKILFHAVSFKAFWAHYSFLNDPVFNNRLNTLGYQIILSDQHEPEEADFILLNEATSVGIERFGLFNKLKYYINRFIGRAKPLPNDVYGKCVKKNLLDKVTFLVMEGPVGMPANHTGYVKQLFPRTLTWNDSKVDGIKIHKFNWPVPEEWTDVESVTFDKKKLFVNISANKYSTHQLELYSDRRDIIKFLEEKYPDDFDLFGIGWNAPATKMQTLMKSTIPNYSSYKGSVEDKAVVFSKYRFAVCYENSCVSGWITEKIFDCMRSNCVPIYLGAPNITDFVDAGTFIDKRNFSSNQELFGFLANMSEGDYKKYISSIESYLESDRFRAFWTTSFAERVVEVLEK